MKINKIMEGPRKAEVTCPACFMQFWPGQGEDKAKCPGCGMVWRIPLPYHRTTKVRGPDWETYPTGDKI
jgi:predicted RNA-binding Zn-ribbon protein involved in translation (DUF1610 family)